MRYKPRRLFSLLVAPLAILTGFAEPVRSDSTALALAVDQMTAQMRVSDVLYGDLDLNGEQEALLLTEEGCISGACDWHLIGSGGVAGWGVLASGSGLRTELVETYPEGHVIRSDGVILAWDGVALRPYHDLLAMMGSSRQAQAAEARLINRLTGNSYKAMDFRVHEADPFLDGKVWRLVVLNGTELRKSQEFHLISPDQKLAMSGTSFERPWLFQDVVDGDIVLRVVSVTSSGFMVETLP